MVCIVSGVEIGLIISILVNALYLLYLWAKPEIHVEKLRMADMEYIRVTPTTAIYFPAINHVRAKVLSSLDEYGGRYGVPPVLIDCRQVGDLDFTAAQGINKLADVLTNLSTVNDNPTQSNVIDVKDDGNVKDNDENGRNRNAQILSQHSSRTPLLILGYLRSHLQPLIDKSTTLVLCDSEEEILQRMLDHASLNSVYINLKVINEEVLG